MGKSIDMKIGDKYNRWTITSNVFYKTFPNGSKAKFVTCQCDCGTVSNVRVATLTSPTKPSISCGCFQKEVAKENRDPITMGDKYGKLLVIKDMGSVSVDGHSRSHALVVCDCGSDPFEVRFDSLKSGKTKSCGCLQKETASKVLKTHGMSKTSAYTSWQSMKNRCRNSNDPAFENYGGRGIDFPDEWLSFDTFWADMKNGWFPDSEIDRIDYNKSYSKENCRWVLRDIGNHNKSKQKGCSSNYKGVYFDKSKCKFVARLQRNGIRYLCSYHNDEYSAALAYDNASEEVYGDRPNKTIN